MKVWIDSDERWPVYAVHTEPVSYAEYILDLPEELVAEVVNTYEAFEEAQHKLHMVIYERARHSAKAN